MSTPDWQRHDGLGQHARRAELEKKLTRMLDAIRHNAEGHLDYLEGHDIPRGISTSELLTTQAINYGVAVGVNQSNNWSTLHAARISYEILREANCHAEADLILPSCEYEL